VFLPWSCQFGDIYVGYIQIAMHLRIYLQGKLFFVDFSPGDYLLFISPREKPHVLDFSISPTTKCMFMIYHGKKSNVSDLSRGNLNVCVCVCVRMSITGKYDFLDLSQGIICHFGSLPGGKPYSRCLPGRNRHAHGSLFAFWDRAQGKSGSLDLSFVCAQLVQV